MKVFYRGKITTGFEILEYLYRYSGVPEQILQYNIESNSKNVSNVLRVLMDKKLVMRKKGYNAQTRRSVYRYYLTRLGSKEFLKLWNEWKRKVKPEFI